jgi:hypothetical protein
VTIILAGNLFSQGFLHTSGKSIVNGNEQEILLRGIGLGGWLVPEGYMLQTSGFANSPTEIMNKIASLIGDTNTDTFFQLYRKNYVTKKDIAQIAAWGFNSIRLPMHYALLTSRDQSGIFYEEGFAIIDSLLNWCETYRLYLILDLHCAPGGQNKDNISDYIPGQPALWESAQNQQRTIELWKKLAERYAVKNWIGGYDLLNEPVWDFGSQANQPLRKLYTDITAAIRQVDNNHIVFIEGNYYATDFNGLSTPWDANMVYSFHKYWNTNDAGAIGNYTSLRIANNVPLWLGESGENSNTWFTDCIGLMERSNIGWSWWPHKKLESTSGLMSVIKNPEYDYLLRYWKGEVSTKPTVAYAVDALNKFAENLKIENCKLNKDVIDAMLRQPFSVVNVPFAENKVPGLIPAVDYDMGKYQSAWFDVDYQNTGNGNWNNGWNYRNDGVDIERCSDIPSNGYNVGWIASGEYLNFTIQVTEAGTYAITARIAGGASGGKGRFKIDGLYATDYIDIPFTGGYQNWDNVSLGKFSLTAGKHTFGANFFNGGFNVNYFDFSKMADISESSHDLPKRFSLSQNFPNPFNPSTNIRYALPERCVVRVSVHDVLGQCVSELANKEQDAGFHEVEWNASVSSGIYFYRIEAVSATDPTQRIVLVRKMVVLK